MINRKRIYKMIFGLGLAGILSISTVSLLHYKSGNNLNSRNPSAINYHRGKLKELPQSNGDETRFQMDLRSTNVSSLDLKDSGDFLMHSDFDSKTKWTDVLPEDFNPQEIMDYGKNPGLNIRKLHEEGITGKGVGIAIIDQTLLTKHDEYKDNLKLYEEINKVPNKAQMHGAAVSSIAVGKNSGVSPDSDLYYIAANIATTDENQNINYDFTPIAKAINRILEINDTLQEENKIRVISMSIGWEKGQTGTEELEEAINKAMSENILIVSSELDKYYSISLKGLGREVLSNPDDIDSYTLSARAEEDYYNNQSNTILLPMDSRCTASPTGSKDYAFYYQGGLSWCSPYLAGLYVLSCQVNPSITPEMFLQEVINTGDIIDVEKDNKEYKLGTIPNPERLIEKII
ncbi:MAG: S8 family serine peptidase [Clostridium sp.]|nr:S8 family serine peptidase [Clostridium sp.]